jgi:hypothetical protein
MLTALRSDFNRRSSGMKMRLKWHSSHIRSILLPWGGGGWTVPAQDNIIQKTMDINPSRI